MVQLRILRIIAAPVLLLAVIAGCAPNEAIFTIREATPGNSVTKLKGGSIYYVQVLPDTINVPGMGAIFYKTKSGNGREVVLLATGVSPNIWQQILPAFINAGGYVAGGAVLGLTLGAAKNTISLNATQIN